MLISVVSHEFITLISNSLPLISQYSENSRIVIRNLRRDYLDYKMFLYTLTTNQLLDSIDYEKKDWISKMHQEVC